MKLRFKSEHIKRYREIAGLLLKYGRADWVRETGLELEQPKLDGKSPPPDQLADDLEAMGPTFVKLGQILSSRSDLLPEPYLKSLERLQDKVKPFPFDDVERIVMTELGARLSKAFSEFDPKPLASASLGQVHRAALRDGRAVVVKVQRPDIRPQIAEDLEVLEELASFFQEHTEVGRRFQFVRIFEEFRKSLLNELDYLREAQNLKTLRENLKNFDAVRVPLPVDDYTTRSVLTMEYISGTKITQLGPLVRLDINGGRLAEELFKAYLKQVLVDGIFHADPHPGNVFLTDDHAIALIDLGMVGRTSPEMQEKLLKLLVAISEMNSDEVADLAIRMSQVSSDFKEADFRRRIGELVLEQGTAALGDIDVGRSLLELGKISGQTGLFAPPELTLLGKTLLQLDTIGKILAPDFNPNEAVKRNATEIMNRRLWKNLTTGKLMGSILEMKEFVGALPSRLNKIMDAVANSEVEVKVRPIETGPFLESFQKIANRITTGLILASLIIGASLLMHIQTPFRILGYPGLAILFFIAAATGGCWLIVNILIQDHRTKRKRHHH